MENTSTKTGLPENAYRELKPGEEFVPVIPAKQLVPEVTPYSVLWGLLFAAIFSAAAAYSGLKIGQVMEAAIPISILAVGISTAVRKSNSLSQNVIIQSIGASSGVIVAGAVFTIPALYILKLDVNFAQIFFSSLLGGFLGILFLIPFRKYFVKDMHGKFPFPEATAITEILVTGEKGGKQAAVLITSGLVGGLFDFAFAYFHLWSETFTSRVVGWGAAIADKTKILFQMNVSAMIFGFGYLIGLRYAMIITMGSLISWFFLIPLINEIGNIGAGLMHTANPFAGMMPEDIFRQFVRPIGIGAIAMAGIIGIAKSSKVIGSAFSLAVAGIFGGNKDAGKAEERTQKDLRMPFIILLIMLSIVAVFIFLIAGVQITLGQAVVALLTVVIISFMFTTVAANAIAIVGSNPVSGMTLMTLILSSLVLVKVGLSGKPGMLSALIIGGIVCTALSMAGGFITDLKVGYWLGITPKKQESYKFLGTLVAAGTVGIVIFMLNNTYGFTPEDNLLINNKLTKQQYTALQNKTADSILVKSFKANALRGEQMAAPQANAMAAVIEPLMSPGAKVSWGLYLVGAIMALIMNFLGISPLAFALGMYLPLPLNTPLIVGGLVAHYVGKSSKNEKLVNARNQRGTLIASGFMAGAALFGVLGVILLSLKLKPGENPVIKAWSESNGAEVLSIVMFVLLVIYFTWDTMRAKAEE